MIELEWLSVATVKFEGFKLSLLLIVEKYLSSYMVYQLDNLLGVGSMVLYSAVLLAVN